MHDAFIFLLAFANIVSLVHLGMFIVGANAYDIKEFKKKAKTSDSDPSEIGYEPLVSVVIPAHNESVVIKRTLNSVRASSYNNFEIIVVDDGSRDNTADIVKDYIRKLPLTKVQPYMVRDTKLETDVSVRHSWKSQEEKGIRYARVSNMQRRFIRVPEFRIRTVRVRQRNAGKAVAMNNAIANYVKGELVMCLDADSMLHPKAIERAVAYFNNPRIIGVAANVRIMPGRSWITVAQRFEHLIGYRSKKLYSLTNSEFIIGGVASTYRTEVLKRANMYDTDTLTEDIGLSLKLIALEGNKNARIIYASDVVAMTEGVQTYRALIRQRYRWKMGCLQNLFKYRQIIGNGDRSKYSTMLTKYRLPMALIGEILLISEPVMFGYIIYISIAYKTVGILLGAYLTITLYTLWTIWPDEHLSNREKIHMSLNALGIYVLFYAFTFVQIAAVFRCLANHKTIVSRLHGHTTWVSPARSGSQAATF